MKKNESNKYINIETVEVIDFNHNLSEKEITDMKRRVLDNMQDKTNQRNRKGMLAAAITAACILLIPTGVYAAGKLNLFGNIFGGAEETPVNDYIEFVSEESVTSENPNHDTIVVEDYTNKVYEATNGTYEIQTDYCMYNEETGAGVIQFTITNQTGDGRQWYEIATVDSYYDDWELGSREVAELHSNEGEGYLSFDVKGLGQPNERVYLKTEESDENKKVCIMIFSDFARVNYSTVDLQLVVKESQYNKEGTDLKWNSILTVDIPKGESLPNLKWVDENGNVEATLSSFDFFVYGIEDGGQDSSVKFTDGSEYHIQNDELKITNELYGLLAEDGIWNCFCNIIDLQEVEAFYFDGTEYPVSEAVIE